MRQFQCPKCGRTLRLRGAVTSRQCTCAEPPPQMAVVDLPPVAPFDASPFVSYNNEEDAAPTEAELVETMPNMPVFEVPKEKPLRRGKGYLRAESSENEEDADDDTPQEEFGAGLDEVARAGVSPRTDTLNASAQSPELRQKAPDAAPAADSTGSDADNADPNKSAPRRRRPRRRRRGERRSDADGPNAEGSAPQTSAPVDTGAPAASATPVSSDGAKDSGGSSDQSASEKPPRKRRRRNRRRRGADGASGEPETPAE